MLLKERRICKLKKGQVRLNNTIQRLLKKLKKELITRKAWNKFYQRPITKKPWDNFIVIVKWDKMSLLA